MPGRTLPPTLLREEEYLLSAVLDLVRREATSTLTATCRHLNIAPPETTYAIDIAFEEIFNYIHLHRLNQLETVGRHEPLMNAEEVISTAITRVTGQVSDLLIIAMVKFAALRLGRQPINTVRTVYDQLFDATRRMGQTPAEALQLGYGPALRDISRDALTGGRRNPFAGQLAMAWTRTIMELYVLAHPPTTQAAIQRAIKQGLEDALASSDPRGR
jgi:hypothetical protein